MTLIAALICLAVGLTHVDDASAGHQRLAFASLLAALILALLSLAFNRQSR